MSDGTGEHRPAGPDEAQGSDAGAVDQGSDAGAAVQADLDALAAAEQEKAEYLELAQRTKADFENFRKRMAAEVQAAGLRGKGELAVGMIGVLDNLERALDAARVDPAAETAPEDALAQGVVMTYRELCSTLERAGIEAYEPNGEKFDPHWHQAMSTSRFVDVEPGLVVQTMAKGYRLGDQVLRAARVVVSE